MQNSLSRYIVLAKRWLWVIVLGIALCGGMSYGISKLLHPVYRATTTLVISFSGPPYESVNAAALILPTYSQLITSHEVLDPVLAEHHELTFNQLYSMISVKPQSNTQLIEIDVDNGDPRLATQLANEISSSFVSFSNSQNTQLPVFITVLPAQFPIDPFSPKPLQNGLIGALVGLGLALALIIIFEWMNDHPASLEEVQELLGAETSTVIPRLSRRQRQHNAEEIPALAEGYRILCTNLNAAQAFKPFKLVMVTSTLADEGKSTTAANLASFLASSGKHVLLVDADLRRPVQYQHFRIDNSKGLSHVLLESPQIPLEMKPYIQTTDIPTLQVLTSGTPCSNFVELLQSSRGQQLFDYFKKALYDYILFDTPPLLPVADTQFLASRIHAVVFVVDASKISRKALSRAKTVFKRMQTVLLGVVVNQNFWSEYGLIHQYQQVLRQPDVLNQMTLPLPPPSTPSGNDASKNGLLSSQTIPITPSTNGVSNNGKSKSAVPVTPPVSSSETDTEQSSKNGSNSSEADPNITITVPDSIEQKLEDEE